MADDADQLMTVLADTVRNMSVRDIVLSQPAHRDPDSASRIDLRPVLIKQQTLFQWSRQCGNQVFHSNELPEQTIVLLQQAAGPEFRNVRLVTPTDIWTAHFSRRGRCRLTRQPVSSADAGGNVSNAATVDPQAHNRQRNYLIPEGSPVPFLVETGIMTAAGRVRARHFHKFRQINRYVEFIADVVERLPDDQVIRIVDFGCGKSYLTFATHHYLTAVAGRTVRITGLDRRSDVIRSCQEIVQRLQLSDLEFCQADIADFSPDGPVHLAISLHACDTATDDALMQAVRWQTEVILAVPCCQHELQSLLPTDNVPLMSRHGIVRERFCAMATDSIRAAVLEQVGYQTKVMEFIDMEHTAKNVLIRAIKTSEKNPESSSQQSRQDLNRFCDVFGIPPLHLQRTLQESGFLLPHNDPAGT